MLFLTRISQDALPNPDELAHNQRAMHAVEELEQTRTAITSLILALRIARRNGQALQLPAKSGTSLDMLLHELKEYHLTYATVQQGSNEQSAELAHREKVIQL